MTRYDAMFERCSALGEAVFGGFLMLGDPDPIQSAQYLDALAEGGADMVELGIPFSDPIADGPVIQAASTRALEAGVRTGDCLAMISAFRSRHQSIPIGILTYANIVAARGIDRFAGELADAGADSLLIADVPSIEAGPYAMSAKRAGIDLVMIAAPTTPPNALAKIANLSGGYTYCLARRGVTGAAPVELDHSALFESLVELGAAPPIMGFGISSPSDVVQAIDHGASGVISGSAIVKLIGAGRPPETVRDFVATMKGATRNKLRAPLCAVGSEPL